MQSDMTQIPLKPFKLCVTSTPDPARDSQAPVTQRNYQMEHLKMRCHLAM